MSLESEIKALRSHIHAIQRKLARPLAQLAIQRMAEEFCLECACAAAGHEPPPESHSFILRGAAAGYLLPTWMPAMRYLEKCREEDQVPLPEHLLRALLPWTVYCPEWR